MSSSTRLPRLLTRLLNLHQKQIVHSFVTKNAMAIRKTPSMRMLSTTAPRELFPKLFSRPRKPRFGLGLVTGGSAVLLFMWSTRRYRDSLVMDLNTAVHTDASEASISSVKKQVPPTVKIVTGNGEKHTTLVDQQQYTRFVQTSVATLAKAQEEMEKEASVLLKKRLDECFGSIHPRADKFADWYFSYSTSFKLLQEATMSLARHAAKILEQTPLHEAVAADMDRYLTRRYERIVLRPEISNTDLQNAYLKCVKDIHARYTEYVASVEKGMLELLSTQTTHLSQPTATDVKLTLDWASQLHKIKTIPANFEKNPELSLILSSGGALIGKTLGGKAGGMATTKVLAGKMSTPFVSKVMTAGGGALAGSLAGPLGTVAGAALGIGIDYTVNAGIELMKREEFLHDVKQVIEATESDYFNIMERELHRATRVWVEDAIQLLPMLGVKTA